MKFLVDENLPRAVAVWVTDRGHDANHVRDLSLGGGADRSIWAAAVNDDAVILTRDADFHLLARGAPPGGVVRLLIGNCTNAVLLQRLAAFWPEIEARLAAGDGLLEVG